jgi:hypothetical protein
MPYTPPRAPTAKRIDMRTLVASLDPAWRDPAEVYLFPNGRKFTEPQGSPPATEPLWLGTGYATSDGKGFYQASTSQMILYGTIP